MKKKRWKLTTGRRHMSDEQRAECLQLYIDGALLRVLVERYGRHRVVIGRLIAGAGVKRGHKFRPKGVRHGGRQKSQPYDHADVQRQHE